MLIYLIIFQVYNQSRRINFSKKFIKVLYYHYEREREREEEGVRGRNGKKGKLCSVCNAAYHVSKQWQSRNEWVSEWVRERERTNYEMMSIFDSTTFSEDGVVLLTPIGSRIESRVPAADNPSARVLGKLVLMSRVCIAISPDEDVSSVSSWGSGLTSCVVTAVKGSCTKPPGENEFEKSKMKANQLYILIHTYFLHKRAQLVVYEAVVQHSKFLTL